MHTITFAAGVLLLILVWKMMLKKTILDHHRDQLFDLRDELRERYLKEGMDLGSPVYRHLRDLINGYLRYTETYRLSKISYIKGQLKHHPDVVQFYRARMEKHFETKNPTESELTNEFRFRALEITTQYMTFGSGFLMVLTLFVFPFVSVWLLIKALNNCVHRSVNKVILWSNAAAIITRKSAKTVSSFIALNDYVEELSYSNQRTFVVPA